MIIKIETIQQNDLVAQRRLRSACTSVQSLLCTLWVDKDLWTVSSLPCLISNSFQVCQNVAVDYGEITT